MRTPLVPRGDSVTNVSYTHDVMMLWVFRRIIDTTVPWPGMHSDPIRSSALAYLTLASIYILPPYVPICSLASCFIYHTHIDIASVLVLTALVAPQDIDPYKHVAAFSIDGLRTSYL